MTNGKPIKIGIKFYTVESGYIDYSGESTKTKSDDKNLIFISLIYFLHTLFNMGEGFLADELMKRVFTVNKRIVRSAYYEHKYSQTSFILNKEQLSKQNKKAIEEINITLDSDPDNLKLEVDYAKDLNLSYRILSVLLLFEFVKRNSNTNELSILNESLLTIQKFTEEGYEYSQKDSYIKLCAYLTNLFSIDNVF